MSYQSPLVSIIVPTFNRVHLIGETLDSVLAQTYTNWECIVVDDGSSDGTQKLLEHYARDDERFRYYPRPTSKLKGSASCRNYALEKALGTYVIFLDSDDLLAPFCLEKRLDFVSKNQSHDLWIFPMQSFVGTLDDKKHVYGSFETVKSRAFFIQKFYAGQHPFAITCVFWKKDTLLKLNGFNDRLQIFTDPDLHLRMLEQGFDFKLALSYPVDCYYRLLENFHKKHNSNFILKNNLVFFESHLNSGILESVTYFKKVYSAYIFDEKRFSYLPKYNQLGIRKKVFGYGIYFSSVSVLLYHVLGLHRVNNSGYHFLKRVFNKNFN